MSKDPPFLMTAFANRLSKPSLRARGRSHTDRASRPHREIGPIGTSVRLLVGLVLVGLIVSGRLATSGHLTPVAWALGLLGFPALVLAWHAWRIRRNPAPFSDTSQALLRAQPCAAPGLLSHGVVRAGPVVHQ